MSKEKEQTNPRGPDRRSSDRRQRYTDPGDLPFPDRRSGIDRRQMDRRIITPEEADELLKILRETEEDKKS
ncbi:MAG: hypothetical protein NTW14_11535 [bacterium]|nr:hypothetical protein [bacterium]